jgi:hypothetical protein
LNESRGKALAGHGTVRVGKARKDVLTLQPLVAFHYGFWSVSGGEHTEYMFDCETPPTNGRLSAKYVWIVGNALQELVPTKPAHAHLLASLYDDIAA